MLKYCCILVSLCSFFLASCGIFGSLNSTTAISAQNSFILGDNRHGPFRVRLKNPSLYPVYLHLAPISGGKHSPVVVQPGQLVTVKVDRNTAVVINNPAKDGVEVALRVVGDTGLGMKYLQQ